MRNQALTLVAVIAVFPATCFAHLGEDHPPGEHSYFPDIPQIEVPVVPYQLDNTTGSWWTDAHHVPGDDQRMMLGSRFQALHMVANGEKNLFLKTGEDYRWALEGMSSFEFHPGFADPTSPGYKKYYTITTERDATETADFVNGDVQALQNVISEWTVDDISANVFSGSRRELFRVQEDSVFHNVNDLEFDDQGLLYIAVGEDTTRLNATNLSNIFGKILRIDPMGTNSANGQYGIPDDNPFVNDPSAAGEIFSYGLRNPWRVSFDPESQEVWAFDVGASSIEEVNRIVPGGNYGWPTKEGSFLTGVEVFPDRPDPETGMTKADKLGLIDPAFEYDHTQGSTIIGGFVYRGEQFPWLQGKVIFADWGVSSQIDYIVPRVFYGDPETGESFVLVDDELLEDAWGTCGSISCGIYTINESADREIMIVGRSVLQLTSLPADFNNDGQLDVFDIDALTEQIIAGTNDADFDVNEDGIVNEADRNAWVQVRKNTYIGDSNLDGQFDEQDIIDGFIAGKYLSGQSAGWAEGDWNGDFLFDDGDFVAAFIAGGYLQGQRAAAVPEPSTWLMLALALPLLGIRRRSHRSSRPLTEC